MFYPRNVIKRIAAAVSAALVTVCLSSCAMTEIPEWEEVHETEVPPRILFLGDSIASGYGLEGYSSDDLYHCRSYANILGERYTAELESQCGHTMVNRAVSGDTSDDFIELLKSGELDADLADSDAVVVSIGGNDLLDIMLALIKKLGIDESGLFDSGEFDLFSAASAFMTMNSDVDKALDHFSDNMAVISEELLKRTEGRVFIQTLYDPLEYYSDFSMVTEFSDEKIGKLNTIITKNASRGYMVIDVASDFKGRAGELTRISQFDIHPNPAGHEAIAETVDKTLRTTGFSYVTTEHGEKQLTADGKKALAGGIVGADVFLTAAVILTVILIKKRGSKE